MERYNVEYWDENVIHTPFSDESIWACKITDNETGIVGMTHRGRSSKTKASASVRVPTHPK